MSYNVYCVSYLGAPRNHQGIFVELNSDLSGFLFQVVGDIQNGMDYGHKEARKPELSTTFVGKEPIGTISKDRYYEIQSVVETIPPPKKQFDGAIRINPREPLRRCQEWTAEAIQALKVASLLE